LDYRPKTTAVILLDMGHTLRSKHTEEMGKGTFLVPLNVLSCFLQNLQNICIGVNHCIHAFWVSAFVLLNEMADN
jgi:hypothetical protein